MTRRAVDQSEKALWQEAMRGVTRYRDAGKAARVLTPRHKSETNATSPATAAPRGNAKAAIAADFGPSPNDETKQPAPNVPGLDRRQALRLRRGQLSIEARLDLHGMTQAEAHRALAGFLARSHAAGTRVVLIVTGKGTRQGADGSPTGVLRRTVPRWLAEPALRPLVLATASALPRDGGDGALYLLLRRAR
jgi:DNA-nicking Smr family endonuclease